MWYMFHVQCEELKISHLILLLVVTMPCACWFLWGADYIEDFKWRLHFQFGVAFWRVVLREVYFEGPNRVWRALKTSILNIDSVRATFMHDINVTWRWYWFKYQLKFRQTFLIFWNPKPNINTWIVSQTWYQSDHISSILNIIINIVYSYHALTYIPLQHCKTPCFSFLMEDHERGRWKLPTYQLNLVNICPLNLK